MVKETPSRVRTILQCNILNTPLDNLKPEEGDLDDRHSLETEIRITDSRNPSNSKAISSIGTNTSRHEALFKKERENRKETENERKKK